MNLSFYEVSRVICRIVHFQVFRELILHRERLDTPGPVLLAVTHIAHLEPPIVGLHTRRHISWVARVEFYRRWWARWVLNAIDAIPVNRDGIPIRMIRTAIARLNEGRIVGIFPEGGVAAGSEAIFRNGRCKAGVCVIAQRANVPIIPVVVLGTEQLNRVLPWLPFRRTRICTAYGNPVAPSNLPGSTPRQRRADFARRLQAEFVTTYQQLLTAANLTDAEVP